MLWHNHQISSLYFNHVHLGRNRKSEAFLVKLPDETVNIFHHLLHSFNWTDIRKWKLATINGITFTSELA
jgi:hypothetical protein